MATQGQNDIVQTPQGFIYPAYRRPEEADEIYSDAAGTVILLQTWASRRTTAEDVVQAVTKTPGSELYLVDRPEHVANCIYDLQAAIDAVRDLAKIGGKVAPGAYAIIPSDKLEPFHSGSDKPTVVIDADMTVKGRCKRAARHLEKLVSRHHGQNLLSPASTSSSFWDKHASLIREPSDRWALHETHRLPEAVPSSPIQAYAVPGFQEGNEKSEGKGKAKMENEAGSFEFAADSTEKTAHFSEKAPAPAPQYQYDPDRDQRERRTSASTDISTGPPPRQTEPSRHSQYSSHLPATSYGKTDFVPPPVTGSQYSRRSHSAAQTSSAAPRLSTTERSTYESSAFARPRFTGLVAPNSNARERNSREVLDAARDMSEEWFGTEEARQRTIRSTIRIPGTVTWAPTTTITQSARSILIGSTSVPGTRGSAPPGYPDNDPEGPGDGGNGNDGRDDGYGAGRNPGRGQGNGRRRNWPNDGGDGGGDGGDDGNDPDPDGPGHGPAVPVPRQRPAAHNAVIHMERKVKADKIPLLESWDGLVKWMLQVGSIVEMGGTLSEDVAQALPRRLRKRPAAWFEALDYDDRRIMTTDWHFFSMSIIDYQGERWLLERKKELQEMHFRQSGHSKETPCEFVSRKLAYLRMFSNNDANPLTVMMSELPVPWRALLRLDNIISAAQLLREIYQHEPEITLIEEGHHDMHNLRDRIRSLDQHSRSNMGRRAHAVEAQESPTLPSREDDSGSTANPDPSAYAVHDSPSNPSTTLSSSSSKPRSNFKVQLKRRHKGEWKYKPPPGGHPFAEQDVKSRNKPQWPCKACGSPWHFDPDCPKWEEFKRRRNAMHVSVDVERPEDVQADYEAEYHLGEAGYGPDDIVIVNEAFCAVEFPSHLARELFNCETREVLPYLDFSSLPDPSFDMDRLVHKATKKSVFGNLQDSETTLAAAIETSVSPEEEILTTDSESNESNEDTQDSLDEGLRKVKIKNVQAFSVTIERESASGEPWACSLNPLSPEFSHILEEFSLEEQARVRQEAFTAIASELPPPEIDSPFIAPPRLRSPPDGMSCIGISALMVPCHIGSREEPACQGQLDSGADITLISESALRSLRKVPKIKTGLKMNLYQLTGSAKIIGYVHLAVWMKDLKDRWIQTEVEAYVVPGMQVPLLLGEDFHVNYGLRVHHNDGGKSSMHIGSSNVGIAVHASKDREAREVFQASRVPLDRLDAKTQKLASRLSPPTTPPKNPEQSKRAKVADRLRHKPIRRLRLKHDVVVPPHTIKSVPVEGDHLGDSDQWFVDATFIERGIERFVSIRPTLLTSSKPEIPLANLTDHPQRFSKGVSLASAVIPEKELYRPKDEEELEYLYRYALAINRIIQGTLKEREAANPDVRPTGQAAPDDPEEDEMWGPKTSEVPDPTVYPSSQLRELLDWGPEGPLWAKERFFKIAEKHKEAFGFDGRLGHLKQKVHIRTETGETPISLPMYGASPLKRDVIDKQLKLWFELDVIEKSISPWAAPVVIVFRNGKPRFCVDYRKLNAVTIADEHPIPRQQEILQALTGAQVLFSMDALSGFTQLEIAEEDREKSAFRTHQGLFQFKRMPFGLRNGPAIFQRIMQGILAPYLWIFALVYIDDIVVFSKTWKEHLEHLDLVLGSIKAAGMTLSPPKCHFGYMSVLLLGQKVSRLGLSTHAEKVRAVMELARPTRISELQTFLGMVVYFSQYIPYYSELVAPLFSLLRKGVSWTWNAEHKTAWRAVKKKLLEAPVLGHPMPGKPYRLYTDASDIALGCCLQQVQPIRIRDLKGTKIYERLAKLRKEGEDVPKLVHRLSSKIDDCLNPPTWADDWEDTEVDVERVIAYWSRTFKAAEKNYSTTEREALGAKEGLVRFQPFIEGEKIILVTDHAALIWARTYENMNRRLAAWGAVFSSYPGLDIVHRPGRVHSNVDPLSRLVRAEPPHDSPAKDEVPTIHLSKESRRIAEEVEKASRKEPARRATREPPCSTSIYDLRQSSTESPVVETIAAAVTRSGGGRSVPPVPKAKKTAKPGKSAQEGTVPAPLANSHEDTSMADDHAFQRRMDGTLHYVDQATLETMKEAYDRDAFFKSKRRELLDDKNVDPSNRWSLSDDGLLWFRDADDRRRLCLPQCPLRMEIVRQLHESHCEPGSG